MNFQFTEEQEMLAKKVRKFADEKLAPIAGEVDESDDVSWEVAKLLAEQEIFRMVTPEGYGGIGFKAIPICIVREELSRVCVHADLLFAEMGLCAYPITTFGTEAQKQKYLPPFAKGEKLGCLSLTEPGAGSDVANIQTTATLDGDYYILNGTKNFASVGPFAHTYTVFVKTDPAQGSRGISAFIVEKGTPGFDGRQMRLMGPHPIAELTFSNCRISKENLLGEPGRGMRIALTNLDFFRTTVGASTVGIAQAALEQAVDYTKRRVQFGQPLAEFQATQFKLADMATGIDAAKLLVYRAAWMKDQGAERITKESSMAKLFSTEMAWQVVDQALQLHGGYGVVKGMPIERLYRVVRQPRVYEGTSEIQRVVIAREVLKG